MNFLSILGSMPSSGSAGGHLNSIDYLKLLRTGIVFVAGYILTAILTTLMRDISGGMFAVPEIMVTPLMGFLTLILEAIRRKFATPAEITPQP